MTARNTGGRNWRDAKLPQWAKDSVQSEIDAYRLTAALSWPTEAKPDPLPFRWGDYDKQIGDPVEGQYWAVDRSAGCFHLARADSISDQDRDKLARAWRGWAFKREGSDNWSSSVVRGPLFATESDVRLYRLWLLCESFARQLMIARAAIARATGAE